MAANFVEFRKFINGVEAKVKKDNAIRKANKESKKKEKRK